MQVAALILPVFAVIVTGWAAGYVGYVSRDLADGLIHFAYNIAMPALLVVTIAQEPARSLLAWRFLVAFGGGSLICFVFVFAFARALSGRGLAGPAMQGWAASMTNTGFVALPVLQATYGPRAVLPAAIATVFVAVVMFPAAVILQELDAGDSLGSGVAPAKLARHVILNPMVLSTLIGVAWSALGIPMPGPVGAYLRILADALTSCALFAIGLGLSIQGLRANFGRAADADRGQARDHAVDRVRPCGRASARTALSDRGRHLRRGSDRQDGLHSWPASIIARNRLSRRRCR